MSEPTKPAWKQSAINGAIIIHPVAGAVAYILGAILGCKKFMPDGARVEYGWAGGSHGLETLFLLYFLTFGILPLVLSAIGAGLGVAFSKLFQQSHH